MKKAERRFYVTWEPRRRPNKQPSLRLSAVNEMPFDLGLAVLASPVITITTNRALLGHSIE